MSRTSWKISFFALSAWLLFIGSVHAQSETFGRLDNSWAYAQDDLGAVYAPKVTTVKLWAPTAYQVRLLLFENATAESFRAVPMSRDEHGIWLAKLDGDMDGKYYLYEISHQLADAAKPMVYRVNDPYARGCSANSGRTLIYDPRKTDPAGWAQDRFVPLKNNVDAVLYEVHIRDFTINKNSGVTDAHRGKFAGMVQSGMKSPTGEKTGLDHLKELGVTHIHLLPAFDFAGGDETQSADKYTWYNWGYDPLLYNTPEGSYASDANGTARQKEFKAMVQAFHRNNIGVVMDVVFNHTAATGASGDSIFDKIAPGYFYRHDGAGRYANATGCGNELASEKPMARKFIVDSIKYWMTEYHVDGFRFDLMGILDREMMREVYREAKKINPSAIIYGEGWDMERVLPSNQMMTQRHVHGTGIAAFNDGIRDNIKGDSTGPGGGFVQGAGARFGGLDRLKLQIKGQSTGKDHHTIEVFSPDETINYASAHDDLCLWDKLKISAPNVPENLRKNMDKLAAGILLTAQGVPFLHAGDEILRSKNLNANSFNDNNPQVNPMDWSLKAAHRDVLDFYRGLIALRRTHPAFRMANRAQVDAALNFLPATSEKTVAFILKNHANGDGWKTILVVYNGGPETKEITATGNWKIVVNDRTAGTETLATAEDRVTVAPFSLVVAHSD